ncbi:MAG: hypothetical protein RL310_731 [Actinomycetota bacterium]
MCVGCMAMAAAAFAGVNAQLPAPAPVIIVQKPTSADLVRAAFKENRIVIKAKQNNRAI